MKRVDTMVVRIKVCGITNEDDALAASQLGAHALGFVFAPSPRRISAERARKIIEQLPPMVQTVGVFVDADPEEVAATAEFCRLDLLQFHGSESAAYCRRFQPRVIKDDRFVPKPLSVEDSLLLLEESGDDFIVFRDSDKMGISVLYRRPDGN